MSEINFPDKENRPGNEYPVLFDERQTPDRESMLYSYQNTVEDTYAGDFRISAKKFGEYLKVSKSECYDPSKEEFIAIPIRYAAPQYAFSDNLSEGSTGVAQEASLTDRVALPLISYYLADSKRDDTRAVDPCVRARYKPDKNAPPYSRALVTHAPIPMDYQFQVDIWTEFREHYYQLLTAFYNDFNPYSYLYDVYDMEDETQKLQYTSYVPMFLDSVVDNSNFVPGTDRRIVRGTLRITVKGWLTPRSNNKPYVHNTKLGINTETARTTKGTTVNRTNVVDTIPAQVSGFLGRTGNVQAAVGDYNADQITLNDSPLGHTVETALQALVSEVNVAASIVLFEPMPMNTCFRIIDGKAHIVTSLSTETPVIDGITLESGGIGSTVSVGKHLGGTYQAKNVFSTSSPLYLSKTGQLTDIRPTSDLGDAYLVTIGRSLEHSDTFIFNPSISIKLN